MLAFGLYTALGIVMDAAGALSKRWVGLKLARHLDQPYLFKSTEEFWTKRWNLAVGSALRFMIYDPIV